MNKKSSYEFIFDWILINKLAVGTSPTKKEDINILKKNNVKNILALCSEDEVKWHENLNQEFNCFRFVLPDSHQKILPSNDQLNDAFNLFKKLINNNATFVHCVASMERSPLFCIMYVMYKHNLSLEEGLDFVKANHSKTNPTNNQLLCIKNFITNNYD